MAGSAHRNIRLSAALLFLTPFTGSALSQIISNIDPPGSLSATASAINAGGQVTGLYQPALSQVSGFIRNSDGSFVYFDPPGSTFTQPLSINTTGAVTGQWWQQVYMTQGFVRDASGNITVFNYPGAAVTQPTRINDSGVIVGSYSTQSSIQGFIRHSDGTMARISYPGSTNTVPQGINNAGEVTGYYDDPSGATNGFLLTADGSYVSFLVPNAVQVLPFAINNSGWIAGCADAMAFYRSPSGTVTTISAPSGASGGSTCANGMNDLETLVGRTSMPLSSLDMGFVHYYKSGYTGQFEAPGAGRRTNGAVDGTVPLGINAGGQVTGYYVDSNYVTHGFLSVK